MGKMIFRRFLTIFLLFAAVGTVTVHGDGLPGEYLLTQRWRDMIATHSPLTNPALLTEENYLSYRLAFAPVLNGEFKLWETGLTLPVGLYQSAGISVIGEDDGLVPEGNIDASGRLVSGGATSTNQNLFIMLSYGWHLWNRLSIGANLNMAYQSTFGDPVMGTGFDLGATYRLLRHSVLGDHLLGLSTQNLIAPAMSSSPVPTLSKEGALSRGLKFSWISNYWERRLESALDVDIKDFMAAASEFKSADGIDFAKALEWDINWKVGVWALRLFSLYTQFGFNEDALIYWGPAFGVNMPSVNNGRDLAILYQYNIMTEENSDASSHTFYVRVDFGKHREEVYARKMARLASMSPNELYNKARKLYSEQKYWDAFFVFSRIAVEFPDFFKNDWVKHYRSSCQEELDMRDVAIKNYEDMKREFPLSVAVPHSDLGLMRVYYRNNDHSRVANQFVELNKPNVPDSLRFHGAYLMGQSHLQNDDPRKAIQVFLMVPEEHPDYIFAQHAIAIARARSNDDMAQIIAALENCIGAKAVTPAQKEIVNRSYVFMGYIFYEENTVSKAVVALRMVPTTSYFAEDALLGQGWTALKARQWNDCISAGQLLTKTTNKEILQCEGMLVQAYGHLLQKDYAQSLALLKAASDKAKNVRSPSQDSLNYERMQYESNRMSYQFLSEKVEHLSNVGQNSTMLAQADSLHTQQVDFVNKFNAWHKFSEHHIRSTFFTRTSDAVRDDIEYALATVQKIMGRSGMQKVQEKMEDKQNEIDSEIERLKKEMEKLQKSQ